MNNHVRIALARFGGSSLAIRTASIRATNALIGNPRATAATSSARQKTGSRLIDVGCPAMVIERLTGPMRSLGRGSVMARLSIDSLFAIEQRRQLFDDRAT